MLFYINYPNFRPATRKKRKCLASYFCWIELCVLTLSMCAVYEFLNTNILDYNILCVYLYIKNTSMPAWTTRCEIGRTYFVLLWQGQLTLTHALNVSPVNSCLFVCLWNSSLLKVSVQFLIHVLFKLSLEKYRATTDEFY